GLDRVVEEHRMDRLAHRVVATERKGHIGHAARGQGMGQVVADKGASLDEVHRVVVVFLDSGRHGEDVRVEDDVFRREADFVDQNVVGALADFLLASGRVGLAGFIKGHDHHGGTVALAQARMFLEFLDPFLHGDGVDDALALDALEARLDDVPLGGVDHDRHPGDIRLAGDKIEEGHHGLLRIQHALVHVDVDHLGAGLDLLQGDLQRFGVVVLADQAGELGAAGNVGALTDVDEQRAAVDGERLQAGQPAGLGDIGDLPRRVAAHRVGNGLDVGRRGAAAAADDIQEAGGGEFADDLRHVFRRLVIFTEGVGQAGVGVGGYIGIGLAGQLFQVGAQFLWPQGAVQADGNRLGVAYRVPEGLSGLAGQGTAGGIGNGARDHDRQLDTQLFEHPLHGENGRLGVEGVEDGLDQDQVGAALDQAAGGFAVVFHQCIEGDIAVAGIVHVRRQRAGATGRPEYPGNEARPVRRFGGLLVTYAAGEAGAFQVQLIGQLFHAIVGLGDPSGVEGVGLDDVRTGIQISLVDGGDGVGAGQHQLVVVALEVARPVSEAFTAKISFLQSVTLDHGAHATVEYQNALAQSIIQSGQAGGQVRHEDSGIKVNKAGQS